MALTEPSLFWLSVAVTLVGIVMAIANFHRWSQRPTGKALGGVFLCLAVAANSSVGAISTSGMHVHPLVRPLLLVLSLALLCMSVYFHYRKGDASPTS